MLEQGDILRERYKVVGRLGQGGMGAVYEAHDNVFDTSVALKEVILDLSSAADTKAQELAQAAFEREAKILAKVNHETIPHVKDYFIEEDSQFLIMELVDGDDLAKLLKERKSAFPVSTLMDWTDQLLDALDYLHTQDPPIIHRDIKPQNLKLTSRKKIKLLDFGIAKGTDAQTANTVTNQTFVAATLNYSPIEQMIRVLDPTFLAVITHKYGPQIEAILSQNADVRTDIFALGATIYHLATNKHPAEAIKRGVDVWDGKPDPLEDPRSLNPEISDDFAEFLIKSMQISRDHRFATAAEMRNALQHIMEVPTQQSLTPTVEMNFDALGGDATVPVTPPPVSQDAAADKTVDLGNSVKRTELKTEVLTHDTAKEQVFGLTGNSASSAKAETGPAGVPAKKKRSKLLWLIPIAGVLLFVFAGSVVGILVVLNQMSTTVGNSNTTSSTPEPDPSPESTIQTDLTVPDETPEDTASPEAEKTVKASTGPTPRPTIKATPRTRPTRTVVKRTPRPTPRRTPVKTPRKTPKKNLDCIFTDSCK